MIDIARIDHQHLVTQAVLLAFVEKPKGARQTARIEKFVAYAHHDIDISGFHQLFPDLLVFMACITGAGRHDESGATGFIQISIKVLNPQAVGIGNGACSGIGSRQTKWQTSIFIHLLLHLLFADAIHVKRRIGHDIVAFTNALLHLVIEGVSLTYIEGIQTMHHHVHARQPGVGVGFFLSIEGDLVAHRLV